jgi:hypothetical protein
MQIFYNKLSSKRDVIQSQMKLRSTVLGKAFRFIVVNIYTQFPSCHHNEIEVISFHANFNNHQSKT